MDRKTRYVCWFARLVWLGIIVNLFFAIPGLVAPTALSAVLGLHDYPGTIWLRNASLLLVLLCLFYVQAARDPLGAPALARTAIFARLLAAVFWLWLLLGVAVANVFWWFFGTDLALGLLQGYFLLRALAASPQPARSPWRRSLFSRVYAGFFRHVVNRFVPWYRLPSAFAQARNLAALREDLRAHNLHDTPEPPAPPPPWEPGYRTARSSDGTFNDLAEPDMGSVGSRFGRNMPLEDCWPDTGEKLLDPSPREVSRRLLARDQFKPATTLNLLAAAWIQFQNHEWFNHLLLRKPQEQPLDEQVFAPIPLADDDDWAGPEEPRVMHVRRTAPDPGRVAGASYPPTYRSAESQWWDASNLYGSSRELQMRLRAGEGGRLRVETVPIGGEPAELLPLDPDKEGLDLTGFSDNYWLGLSLLHTLFVREHNAICARLQKEHPLKDDEWLFQKARLINAALMAKIHTVEWTPGILNRKVIRLTLNANWWGILGRWFKLRFGRVSDGVILSGIVGASTEHHAMSRSLLTEEFVAVYRLHPLIPDEITFRSLSDPSKAQVKTFDEVLGRRTRPAMSELGTMNDLFYTLGVEHPGAITLRNYPNSLRNFTRIHDQRTERLDLAAVDIFRDRERGVPRYNRFRELLRMPRVRTFEEMTGRGADDELVRALKKLYKNDIDRVDLMVGMYAEPVPAGFGFSDTAFRIFILMASRRLHSDRFFTADFSPEIYTPAGINWINQYGMLDVLRRHYPKLAGPLEGSKNAFAPWKKVP